MNTNPDFSAAKLWQNQQGSMYSIAACGNEGFGIPEFPASDKLINMSGRARTNFLQVNQERYIVHLAKPAFMAQFRYYVFRSFKNCMDSLR